MDYIEKLGYICKVLYENKAENILYINTSKNSNIVNFFIIATGSSVTHVKSLIDICYEEICKTEIFNINFREGFNTSKWQVLDLGDGFIHIFTKEEREKYNIEKLLSESGNTMTYAKLLKKIAALKVNDKKREREAVNIKDKNNQRKKNKINEALYNINKDKK